MPRIMTCLPVAKARHLVQLPSSRDSPGSAPTKVSGFPSGDTKQNSVITMTKTTSPGFGREDTSTTNKAYKNEMLQQETTADLDFVLIIKVGREKTSSEMSLCTGRQDVNMEIEAAPPSAPGDTS